MEWGCLGRLQISGLQTQQVCHLQTQQVSLLQTQQVSLLQTQQVYLLHKRQALGMQERGLVLETLNKQINFEVLDPDLGCLVLETPKNGLILRCWTPT